MSIVYSRRSWQNKQGIGPIKRTPKKKKIGVSKIYSKQSLSGELALTVTETIARVLCSETFE